MGKHFYTCKEFTGYSDIVGDESGLELTRLGLIRLENGKSVTLDSGEYEIGLVVLSGKCDVECDGMIFSSIGNRKDVFAGKPASVYIPRDCSYAVKATGDGALEAAVCKVRADRKYQPFAITPEDVVSEHRGILNWQRKVIDIITYKYEGKVDRIVLGETYSYPGQWSSYPPHKHDTDNPPAEVNMEEIYHYKLNNPKGFGVQLMYNDDLSMNECYMIRDGDSAAIDRGYHPVASAPGYKVYYLWVMAGRSGRNLTPRDDPKHAWVKTMKPSTD